MILVAIIALSMVVIGVLVPLAAAIFSVPSDVVGVLATALTYVVEGAGFIQQFFYWDIVSAMLTAVIAMDTAYVTYRVALWLLEKVPMFGVK